MKHEIKDEKIYLKKVKNTKLELNGKQIIIQEWQESDDMSDTTDNNGWEIVNVKGKGGKELDLTDEEKDYIEENIIY